MPDHETLRASTTEALPVAPSLGPTLDLEHADRHVSNVDVRVLFVSVISMGVALLAAFTAQVLARLIALITNFAFFGKVSGAPSSPAGNHLGPFVVAVPILGGLLVGLMAKYGSKAIRGHGIPEAMEQILFNESRIPARMTFLKPLSAAIAIGTGGPFGAEGPIIATGGALGSLAGQLLKITADERKTLLSAGAAAGMAATFGSPVSAVLLAIELLLFEYRPRSIIPVALASATATGVRGAFVGFEPAFAMPNVSSPGATALAFYILLGAVLGVAAIGATRAIYRIEDAFERIPLHWMWWPALGGIVVGLVGYVAPRTMGVGYDNIQDILGARVVGSALLALCVLKFVSWSVALGSGTSGGTLAPLFTIGGALGGLLGASAFWLVPTLGVDARIAALVGMAAMFAGASHAPLASVLFAFETTRQPLSLLPLLGGSTAAYFLSCFFMRTSIMTEKIARRGIHIRTEYSVDVLSQTLVKDFATGAVVALQADDLVRDVRSWILSKDERAGHTGYPVIDEAGVLLGVVTRRDLLNDSGDDRSRVRDVIMRPPEVIYEDSSLRDAADKMVNAGVGRLAVVSRSARQRVLAIITRSDLLRAHKRRLDGGRLASPSIEIKRLIPNPIRGKRA